MAVLIRLPGTPAALVRLLRAIALGVLLAAGWSGVVAQSEEEASETRVKAAFLYKFGGYIEWPASAFGRPDAPFMIGVLGADELADALTQIAAGRNVNGRPIVVRKLKRGAPLSGLHVLFVGRADGSRLAEVLAPVKGQPTLLVTESDEALARGSMINFVVVADKVRFDVAPASAELGNLKISARLLTVARKVVAGPT